MLADRGDAEARTLGLPPMTTASPSTPTRGESAVQFHTAASTNAPASTPAPAGTSGAATSGIRTPASSVRGVVYTIGQGSRRSSRVREKLAQVPLPNDATMRDTAVTGEIRLDGVSTVRMDLRQLS